MARAHGIGRGRDAGVVAVDAVAGGAGPARRACALPAHAHPPPDTAALDAVLAETFKENMNIDHGKAIVCGPSVIRIAEVVGPRD